MGHELLSMSHNQTSNRLRNLYFGENIFEINSWQALKNNQFDSENEIVNMMRT